MGNKKGINLTAEQYEAMKKRNDITGVGIDEHNRLEREFEEFRTMLYLTLGDFKHDVDSFNFIMNEVMSVIETVTRCYGVNGKVVLDYLRNFEW